MQNMKILPATLSLSPDSASIVEQYVRWQEILCHLHNSAMWSWHLLWSRGSHCDMEWTRK